MRRAGEVLPRLWLLSLALLTLAAPPAAAGARRAAVLVLVDGISLEDALAISELADLAVAGGVGLLPAPEEGAEALTAGVPGEARVLETAAARLGPELRRLAAEARAALVLVVVAAPVPTAEMRARGDGATPVLVARGSPDAPLGGLAGPLRGLTSDSTRRDGIVAPEDVGATLRAFLGVPVGEGSPIRVEGEAPLSLHGRYLGVRRVAFPLQIAILGVALGGLLVVWSFLLARGRAAAAARALGVWALAAIALPVAALPVGALPEPGWVTAPLTLVAFAAGIVGAALWVGRRGATLAVGVVAAAAVSVLVVDAAGGWRAMMVPVIGGGALDGARYFGIGNVYVGVLLAGALLVAAHLPSWGGVGILAGAALLAGLPGLGSNLGGAATLFAAAGLWYGLRLRRGLGWAEVGIAAAVVAAGVAVVVAAHAIFAAGDTHIARFAEGSSGPGDVLATIGRRLRINLELTSRVPVAWLLVAAFPAIGVAAWRRWGPLARDPEWRDACLVLAIAALVGFLANDTGVGVAGLSFAFLAAALAYPALEERWTRG